MEVAEIEYYLGGERLPVLHRIKDLVDFDFRVCVFLTVAKKSYS